MYNDEPMQDFEPKNGAAGGCYAAGVYSALSGTFKSSLISA